MPVEEERMMGKPSTFYLTEVKLPPSASSSFYHELEFSEAYRSLPSSPDKKSRGRTNQRKKRRGAVFCNVFEDDAEGDGNFYDLSFTTPRHSSTQFNTINDEDFGVTEVCRSRYVKACRQLKIPPSTRLLNQLKDNREVIDLRGMNVGQKGLNAVCAALIEHTNATKLDVGENGIEGKMVSYIAQLLSYNSVITDLVLADNHLSGEGVAMIAKMLQKENDIKILDLSGNKLTDSDAVHVAEIIRNNPQIVNLKLNHNQFRIGGGQYLGKALEQNRTLDRLDLSWNHLRGRGADSLALGLMKNRRLTVLDISWNGFGFEGCVAIAHALVHNKTLHHLNMESNRIHPPALFELSKGLVRNTTLQTLRIGNNPITAICTTPFLQAIKDSDSRITVLDMTGVIVGFGFEDTLLEILEKRPLQVYYEKHLPIHKDRWGDTNTTQGRKKVFNIDPIQILFQLKKNLRNVDLFRMMDRDNSASLSRDEIGEVLRINGYPVSSNALDQIMDYLDDDGDGCVDLGEFVLGERRFRRKNLSKMERESTGLSGDQLLDRMDSEIIPATSGGSLFSSTYRSDLTDQGSGNQGNQVKGGNVKLPKI